MAHETTPVLAAVLALALASLMAMANPSLGTRILEGSGGLLLAGVILALGKRPSPPLWARGMILHVATFLIVGLMLLDSRPLLPGLLLFLLIPAAYRMPLVHRLAAYLEGAASLALVYVARGLLKTVDPLVPACQVLCLASLAAFTEMRRLREEKAEESERLLEELINSQRSQAAGDQEARGRRDLAARLAPALARAALEVAGAGELAATDQAGTVRLAGRARKSLKEALDLLKSAAEDGGPEAPAPPAGPPRIFLAHGNEDFLESLALVLEGAGRLRVEARATSLAETAALLKDQPSDLVLVDEALLEGLGLEAGFQALRREVSGHGQGPYLLMSALPDHRLRRRAREAGFGGVLDLGEDPRDLVEGIIGVARAGRDAPRPGIASRQGSPSGYTVRDRQILDLIAKGFSNKEIAARLFLAEGTVKNQVTAILHKIDARDRANAALKARDLGLI